MMARAGHWKSCSFAWRAAEEFSPNVVLRPVYREHILPNIAYIGGGGELAYWIQLRWLLQALRVPMPVLFLRTSAATVVRSACANGTRSGLLRRTS